MRARDRAARRAAENPFPATAVARNLSDLGSGPVSISTVSIQKVIGQVDEFLDNPTWENSGNVVTVVGDFGSGKTHHALEVLRGIRVRQADGIRDRGAESIHAVFIDAPADSFHALYRERFIPRLQRSDVRALVVECYSDVVAAALDGAELTKDLADRLGTGDLEPFAVVEEIGLMENTLMRELRSSLHTLTEKETFARALTLLLRPEFERHVWAWLSGEEPIPALVERGIGQAIDNDTAALEAIGMFAFLFGRRHHRLILIIDELEKVLSRAHPLDVASGQAFKKLLEIFADAGGFLLLCGLPESVDLLPADTRQRIGRQIRPSPLTATDVRKYIEETHERAFGSRTLWPFDASAVELIAQVSGGSPRTIVRLCHQCFGTAVAADGTVTAAMVRQAAEEYRPLERSPAGPLRSGGRIGLLRRGPAPSASVSRRQPSPPFLARGPWSSLTALVPGVVSGLLSVAAPGWAEPSQQDPFAAPLDPLEDFGALEQDIVRVAREDARSYDIRSLRAGQLPARLPELHRRFALALNEIPARFSRNLDTLLSEQIARSQRWQLAAAEQGNADQSVVTARKERAETHDRLQERLVLYRRLSIGRPEQGASSGARLLAAGAGLSVQFLALCPVLKPLSYGPARWTGALLAMVMAAMLTGSSYAIGIGLWHRGRIHAALTTAMSAVAALLILAPVFLAWLAGARTIDPILLLSPLVLTGSALLGIFVTVQNCDPRITTLRRLDRLVERREREARRAELATSAARDHLDEIARLINAAPERWQLWAEQQYTEFDRLNLRYVGELVKQIQAVGEPTHHLDFTEPLPELRPPTAHSRSGSDSRRFEAS